MYEHVKTGCKHIPPSEQPLQFQSGYYLDKPRIVLILVTKNCSSLKDSVHPTTGHESPEGEVEV